MWCHFSQFLSLFLLHPNLNNHFVGTFLYIYFQKDSSKMKETQCHWILIPICCFLVSEEYDDFLIKMFIKVFFCSCLLQFPDFLSTLVNFLTHVNYDFIYLKNRISSDLCNLVQQRGYSVITMFFLDLVHSIHNLVFG